MASRIQRYARALIDIFDIKETSGVIQNLLSDIAPTVDTTDLFGAERLEREGATSATVAAPGGAVFLEVPQGQTWLVYAISGTLLITTAGDIARVGLGVRMAGESMQIGHGPTYTSGGVAAGPFEAFHGIVLSRPYVLRAGDAVFVQAVELTITPPSVAGTIQARIARFGPQSSAVFA